eukprot:5255638-Prymnesium_polylepis.1
MQEEGADGRRSSGRESGGRGSSRRGSRDLPGECATRASNPIESGAAGRIAGGRRARGCPAEAVRQTSGAPKQRAAVSERAF